MFSWSANEINSSAPAEWCSTSSTSSGGASDSTNAALSFVWGLTSATEVSAGTTGGASCESASIWYSSSVIDPNSFATRSSFFL